MPDAPEILEKLEALREAVESLEGMTGFEMMVGIPLAFRRLMDFLDTIAESNRPKGDVCITCGEIGHYMCTAG